MRSKVTRIGVGLAVAVLFTVGLALAKTVKIEERAKLANGSVLEPGSYKVEVLGETTKPEVDFYQGNHLVAKTSAKLEALTRKVPNTAIYYNNAEKPPMITGIEMEGAKDKLVFTGTGNSGRGGE
jgi:hypothetical protein